MDDKEFAIEKIRSQYTEQHTDLDVLKALDAKVKKISCGPFPNPQW